MPKNKGKQPTGRASRGVVAASQQKTRQQNPPQDNRGRSDQQNISANQGRNDQNNPQQRGRSDQGQNKTQNKGRGRSKSKTRSDGTGPNRARGSSLPRKWFKDPPFPQPPSSTSNTEPKNISQTPNRSNLSSPASSSSSPAPPSGKSGKKLKRKLKEIEEKENLQARGENATEFSDMRTARELVNDYNEVVVEEGSNISKSYIPASSNPLLSPLPTLNMVDSVSEKILDPSPEGLKRLFEERKNSSANPSSFDTYEAFEQRLVTTDDGTTYLLPSVELNSSVLDEAALLSSKGGATSSFEVVLPVIQKPIQTPIQNEFELFGQPQKLFQISRMKKINVYPVKFENHLKASGILKWLEDEGFNFIDKRNTLVTPDSATLWVTSFLKQMEKPVAWTTIFNTYMGILQLADAENVMESVLYVTNFKNLNMNNAFHLLPVTHSYLVNFVTAMANHLNVPFDYTCNVIDHIGRKIFTHVKLVVMFSLGDKRYSYMYSVPRGECPTAGKFFSKPSLFFDTYTDLVTDFTEKFLGKMGNADPSMAVQPPRPGSAARFNRVIGRVKHSSRLLDTLRTVYGLNSFATQFYINRNKNIAFYYLAIAGKKFLISQTEFKPDESNDDIEARLLSYSFEGLSKLDLNELVKQGKDAVSSARSAKGSAMKKEKVGRKSNTKVTNSKGFRAAELLQQGEEESQETVILKKEEVQVPAKTYLDVATTRSGVKQPRSKSAAPLKRHQRTTKAVT